MGFHVINIEDGELKHGYVEVIEELAYVEFINDDSVIYQGEEHWRPFKVSESIKYQKFAQGWYRAGIKAQELFKKQARDDGFILEELNQDQRSFKLYTANSENMPIKRGDFIVRNYGNIEIDVKCRSFRKEKGEVYFDFLEEDAYKHQNMQSFTKTPVLIAVYENRDNCPVKDNIYFFKIDDILNNNDLRIVSRDFGDCYRIPVSFTNKSFDFIRQVYKEHISSSITGRPIKYTYPNAYEKWTEEDDNKLELLYCEGSSVKELCKIFGRNNGAIRARIKKLELEDKYDFS